MIRDQIITAVCPPLDVTLLTSLIEEFINMERRYVLCDWEPAVLDGGQFAEILSRIIYHTDSGNLNRRKDLDSCLRYIEDENNSNRHNFPSRRACLHICKVLRTIYKFRSQRGAVHIDPDYSANEIDSNMLINNVRWLMSETLRIFWNGDIGLIVKTIKEIVDFKVPSILKQDNKYFVLRTDCSTEEEILLLLYNAGLEGVSRKIIGEAIPKDSSTVSNAIRKMAGGKLRLIILKDNGNYILTPNGTKLILTTLGDKLSLS